VATIPRKNTVIRMIATLKTYLNFTGIRPAGNMVCCAPLGQASCEKSRQFFPIPCSHSKKTVTPFALGHTYVLFACSGQGVFTSPKVLALTSGRFKNCGAQWCGLRSYFLCAPLTHWLAPQPLTPVRTRSPGQRSVVELKSQILAHISVGHSREKKTNALRLSVRSCMKV
jgi:hypothetical protein